MGNWWQVGASSNQKGIIVIIVEIHGRTMGHLKREDKREYDNLEMEKRYGEKLIRKDETH